MKIFFLTLILCLATLQVHAMKRNIAGEEKTYSREEEEIQAMDADKVNISGQNYYVYREGSWIFSSIPEQWRYFYSPSPMDYNAINPDFFTDAGLAGMFNLRDFLGHEDRPAGYYIFRMGNRVIPFLVNGIDSFTSHVPHELNLPENVFRFVLTAAMVRDDPSRNIRYRIEAYNPDTMEIQENGVRLYPDEIGEFNAGTSLVVRVTDLQQVVIHASYNHTTFSVVLEPYPKKKNLFLLMNANDSNGNFVADHREEGPMTGLPQNRDPELLMLNIFRTSGSTDSLLQKKLREPGAFEPVAGKHPVLTLLTTSDIEIYSSPDKGRNFHTSIPELNIFEWTLTPANRIEILNNLSRLYLEGTKPSSEAGNQALLIEYERGDEIIRERWEITTLHILINRSMPPSHWVKNGIEIPRTKNSKFIPHLNADFIQTMTEEFTTIYELQSLEPEMLNLYAHLLEWRIHPQGNEEKVRIYPNASANTGKTLRLYGINPGTFNVGVRLKSYLTDYLTLEGEVRPLQIYPVAFQFFASSDKQHAANLQMADRVPGLLDSANWLGLQACIQFKPVNPEEVTFYSSRSNFDFNIDKRVVEYLPNSTYWAQYRPVRDLIPRDAPNFGVYRFKNLDHPWRGMIERTQSDPEEDWDVIEFRAPIIPPAVSFPKTISLDFSTPMTRESRPGILLHRNVPDWVTDRFGWPYSLVVSASNRVLTFNVCDTPQKILASLQPSLPSPFTFHSPAGDVDISFKSKANLFGILLGNDLAAAAIPLEMPYMSEYYDLSFCKTMVASACEMLGQKPRGLHGDLDGYAGVENANWLSTAIAHNILLKIDKDESYSHPDIIRDPVTDLPISIIKHVHKIVTHHVLNPVIPAVDHPSANINVYDDILSFDPNERRGYRIDEVRARLLFQSPL